MRFKQYTTKKNGVTLGHPNDRLMYAYNKLDAIDSGLKPGDVLTIEVSEDISCDYCGADLSDTKEVVYKDAHNGDCCCDCWGE